LGDDGTDQRSGLRRALGSTSFLADDAEPSLCGSLLECDPGGVAIGGIGWSAGEGRSINGPKGEGNKIGRVTTSGVFTEFPIPTPVSLPISIAAGSDGNLWFTEFEYPYTIGRVSTSGAFTEFPVPTPVSGPYAIAAGPDSNLWFTEYWSNKIGYVRPSTRAP
jgi:hypothetical protein